MQMVQEFNSVMQTLRHIFLNGAEGWQILRINPTSDANHGFFDVVAAIVAGRSENEREILDQMIEAVKELDFTVTFSPKVETIRNAQSARAEKAFPQGQKLTTHCYLWRK